ncbi:MAG: glycoside hydrolase family 57 protein [Pseudomonadota bacterium]
MSKRNLYLILCWHMHQPDYRDSASGEFRLPWTYLHALKDYSDMVAHLEAEPRARAVFNFVPVLLDQLEDYVEQFASGRYRDPLLRLLAREDYENLTQAEREFIFECGFRLGHEQMVAPYPSYRRLHELYEQAEKIDGKGLDYLSAQYLVDLMVWYHLVWIGETICRSDPLPVRLMAKGEGFDFADRKALLQLIARVIGGLIPRYRALAAAGRIEISSTPYTHPIAPLLIDFQTAREAWPEALLPRSHHYPGGRDRVVFHVRSAIESHARRFDSPPAGFWPAEGGISDDVVSQFAKAGLSWTASGGTVLANSLRRAGEKTERLADYLYRPYRDDAADRHTVCFFRDDKLSDLIGFEYSKWHGADAVAHFVAELERIHGEAGDREAVVSVILDGENAWEYYPYNGFYFLSGLYAALSAHPYIRMTTFSEYLAQAKEEEIGKLPRLVAGSWVYGTFSTWIGDPAKNAAWDLLCDAKRTLDKILASGVLDESASEAVLKQLAVCESSDWFWWFGDYNPAHAVASFDKLYRDNLKRLYQLLGVTPPSHLDQPICRGEGKQVEAGGTMRRSS